MTSGSRYNAMCRLRGKLPDKCLQTIMGQTVFSTSNFSQKYKAKAKPPQQANTFTDASVLLPRMPWAAYAGIGIVHIDRDFTTEPIHSIEEEMTKTRSDPTRRNGTMNSAINNSTRMELTAAIIATNAPRPMPSKIRRSSRDFEGSRTEGTSQATGLIFLMGTCGFSGKVSSLPGVRTPYM